MAPCAPAPTLTTPVRLSEEVRRIHEHATSSSGGKEVPRFEQGSRGGVAFEGIVLDENLNGFGAITFPNGSVYEGECRDRRPHGAGSYTTPYGTVLCGQEAAAPERAAARRVAAARGKSGAARGADDVRRGRGLARRHATNRRDNRRTS